MFVRSAVPCTLASARPFTAIAAFMLAAVFAVAAAPADALAGNTWSTTGSMSVARYVPTATVLHDGKVLVAGGYTSSGATHAVELYDPATGAWSTTSPMSVPRRRHTATLLPDGRVLVTGGETAAGARLSSAEIYDPVAGIWSPTAPMTTGSSDRTAILLQNGKVLVAGGDTTTDPFSGSAGAELYDPATGTWSVTGSLVTRRQRHGAALLPDGKVLVVAGWTSSGDTRTSEVYDPATGTWTQAGAVANGRSRPRTVVLPTGKVLMIAGVTNGQTIAAEVFDPTTGTWSSASSAPSGRDAPAVVLLGNGKVLSASGATSTSGATADLYSVASNTWASAGSLSTARQAPGFALLADGRVLVAGGVDTGGSPITAAELYTPTYRPVVSGGGTLSYTENEAAQPVAPGVEVADADDSVVKSASLAITSGAAAGQDQLSWTDNDSGDGITRAGSSATAVNLTGNASVAQYQAALRAVRYANTSDAPSTAPRAVTVTVTDADNEVGSTTATIVVAAVNDEPQLRTTASDLAYAENAGPVAVDPDLVVEDTDDSELRSAQVTIASGHQAGDHLALTAQNGISGSYDASTGVLTATGTATVAQYRAALRSVTFAHSGEHPAPTRTIAFTASDGDADARSVSRGVAVSAVDDAPVAVDDTKTIDEDATATAIGVLANDTDADGGPKTVAAKTNGTNGTATITSAGNDVTYTPNAGWCGTDTFTYTLNGGSPATVTVTVTCAERAQPPAQPAPSVTPAPAPARAPSATAGAPPPSISDVQVARRCVRGVGGTKPVAGTTGLSVAFTLSEDATVRFEIRRRDGSPARRLCPVRSGNRAGTYTRISQTTSKQTGGQHDVTLATTASRRTAGPVRLRAGRRSIPLARIAAGRKLRPGTYVLRLTAATANGQSRVVSVKFWVLEP